MKEEKMVHFVTNEEHKTPLFKRLMADDIPGLTVSELTIKAGSYEPTPGWGLYVSPGVVTGPFWLVEERPSIDINKETDEIPIVILEHEDGFTACPLEIDGVVSQGDSLAEALENVKNAISLHLEAFGVDALPPKSDRATKVFLAKTRLQKQETDNAENAP